jgi:hypothetical protein
MSKDPENKLSMEEIEAEDAVSLPDKEVMSLLDVNANVDLGLDLAAPVDLAAAANLNVAAPIEASAAANVLSPGAQAVSEAYQHGSIDQSITGSADATAPQHATVAQDSTGGGGTAGTDATGAPNAGADPTATPPTAPDSTTSGTAGTADATTGAVDGATSGAAGAVDGVAGAAGDATQGVTGSADSLLNGGSLLDANVDIHAAADLAAPVDGAVAANANVAAPIDAAVSANVGSPNAGAEALAPQEVDISQHLDGVEADATATQDASVEQN